MDKYFEPIKEVKEKEDINENDNEGDKKWPTDEEISKSLEKERQLKIKKEKEKAELNSIIELLKLGKDKLTKSDILRIKGYLCPRVEYFKKLLEQSEEKLLRLIPYLNYETFKAKERIINFGDEGDKCYILLKGRVGIYKPFPISKKMTLREYVEHLVHIKDIEKNMPKFERILSYNSKIDNIKLYAMEFDYTKLPKSGYTINIMLEEERELGQGHPGSYFGEMALIKNEPRNASIIALERCDMVSIEKMNYTKIVKDIEEQRINKDLLTFKQNYPLFRFWSPSKCFRLLSGFITEEYGKDDYVYRQNDIPTGIYLVKSGMFELSINITFDLYEKLIEYIHDTAFSLITDIDDPFKWKEDKIIKKLNAAYKNNSGLFVIKKDNNLKLNASNQKEDNEDYTGFSCKNDIAKEIEEEIEQNKNQIIKARIQNLESPNIFGFFEIFELKHRVSSIKCLTQKGVLLKFPLLEFLQLLPTDKKNQFYLQQRIFEEKKVIIGQLKNCILAKLNFVKNENKKRFYLKKDFFLNKNNYKYTNLLYFKKQQFDCNLAPLNNRKINHDYSSAKLSKSKSTDIYNLSKINKNEKILSTNNNTNNEPISNYESISPNKDNSFEGVRHNARNGIILGFKKSVIKLTRDKMAVIKALFPKEINQSSYPPQLNINQINNSDEDYIRYLENNIEVNQSPTKLINLQMCGSVRSTGKKYISIETSKYISKLNKNNNKTTKSTVESKMNSDIILPYINNKKSQGCNNDENACNSPRLINYKIEV